MSRRPARIRAPPLGRATASGSSQSGQTRWLVVGPRPRSTSCGAWTGSGPAARFERELAVVDGEVDAADGVGRHELGDRGSDGLVDGRRCRRRRPARRSPAASRAHASRPGSFRVTESASRVMVSRSVIAPATAITTPSPTVPWTASISRTTGGVATETPSSAAQRPRHGRRTRRRGLGEPGHRRVQRGGAPGQVEHHVAGLAQPARPQRLHDVTDQHAHRTDDQQRGREVPARGDQQAGDNREEQQGSDDVRRRRCSPIWPASPMTNTQTTSSVEHANASRSMSRARSTRIAPTRVSCSRLQATSTNMA